MTIFQVFQSVKLTDAYSGCEWGCKDKFVFLILPRGALLASGPTRTPSLRRIFEKSILIIRLSPRLPKGVFPGCELHAPGAPRCRALHYLLDGGKISY